MRPLAKSGGPSVEKGGESDMESRDIQGFSHCLCRLRIDGLVSVSNY
jgi:hypothetical protein